MYDSSAFEYRSSRPRRRLNNDPLGKKFVRAAILLRGRLLPWPYGRSPASELQLLLRMRCDLVGSASVLMSWCFSLAASLRAWSKNTHDPVRGFTPLLWQKPLNGLRNNI